VAVTEQKQVLAFVLLVSALTVFILAKSIRFSWDEGAIAVTITGQNGKIETLDTPRKPSRTIEILTKHLAFAQGSLLENRQYGSLGFTDNFFIDADTRMHVKKLGRYRFSVWSDDGFRLEIDGRTLCEHPLDRPYAKTECTIRLLPGEHRLALSYFQGGGPMGLKVEYGPAAERRRYLLGENTSLITFEKRE